MHHGPVRRPIVRRRQDVDPGQAVPGTRDAARQQGCRPLFGRLGGDQGHRMQVRRTVPAPLPPPRRRDPGNPRAGWSMLRTGPPPGPPRPWRPRPGYADPRFEVARGPVQLVDRGAGKRQIGSPCFQPRHARRQIAHQLARVRAPVGHRRSGPLRRHLLQAWPRFRVQMDVGLRQSGDGRPDLDVGQRLDHSSSEVRYAHGSRSPGTSSAPATTWIDEPSKSSPIGSCRPPRQRARNASATAMKDRLFSGRAKPWPSSGYSR